MSTVPPPVPPAFAAPVVATFPMPTPTGVHGHDAPRVVSLGATPNIRTVSPWGRLGAKLLESILIVVTLGVGWVIWAAMTAGAGQTPAKRLLSQRVIDAETLRPASLGKMFWIRGVVAGMVASIAIPFTLGILLFMPFWDKRNQNLWDKVSNTYVVHDA